MNENQEHEIIEAAAAGAAAAVDAVQDEHHEDERSEAMQNATAVASETAQVAGDEAQRAAEAATAASEAALEAHAQASEAEATASQAATEAEQAQSSVETLTEYMRSGFSELRDFIGTALAPKEPDTQPTEVTVTHGDEHRPDTGQTGSDTGSGESASGTSGDSGPYRHRFGRRRG